MPKRKLTRFLTWPLMALAAVAALWTCWWMYDCSHRNLVVYPRLQKDVEAMLIAADRGDLRTSDSIARIIYEEGRANDDRLHEAYGLYGMGLFSPQTKDSVRRGYLLKAEGLAQSLQNDSLLSHVYNALGAYATGVDHDFPAGRRYFMLSAHHARRQHDLSSEMKARCNLSEVMRMMRDTADIESDLEVYSYAHATGQERLLNAAAHHCANYYLTADPAKSLPFIETLREVGDTNRYNLLMLDYGLKTADHALARTHMDLAWSHDSMRATNIYNNGLLLNREGHYRESAAMLERARKAFVQNRTYETAPPALSKLQAENYAALGNDAESRRWYERYIAERDSADLVRSASEVARLKIVYEIEKKDRQVEQSRQRTMQITLLAALLGFIIIAGGGGVWYHSWRRRQYMETIVRQNEERRRLTEQVAAAATVQPEVSLPRIEPAEILADDSPRPGSMADATRERIWQAVQQRVADGTFNDPNVTRDSFAEAIGSNRTYLSKVIKEKTGMTFQQYLLDVRVEQAIALLSQPSDPGGMKEVGARVGFLSTSTFYPAFKAKTGMSPAQYRKTYLALERKNTPETVAE